MSTDRELRISEIFESLQGEGPSAGLPSVFLRLATCNLGCSFCDTKYTWDWTQFRYEEQVSRQHISGTAARLTSARARRLVITGGEPLLQQKALAPLLDSLGDDWLVEVETNGTVAPSPALSSRIDQWNVSPKLANSGEPIERRIVPGALISLRDTGRAWLKWVIGTAGDAEEASEITVSLEWPRSRVLFMPLASTRSELVERAPVVTHLARDRGFATSPRLHIERWDGKRGV